MIAMSDLTEAVLTTWFVVATAITIVFLIFMPR